MPPVTLEAPSRLLISRLAARSPLALDKYVGPGSRGPISFLGALTARHTHYDQVSSCQRWLQDVREPSEDNTARRVQTRQLWLVIVSTNSNATGTYLRRKRCGEASEEAEVDIPVKEETMCIPSLCGKCLVQEASSVTPSRLGRDVPGLSEDVTAGWVQRLLSSGVWLVQKRHG
jgi:hypothetical protein